MRSNSHAWFGVSASPKTFQSWRPSLFIPSTARNSQSCIFHPPDYFFLPKKSQPSWEAEIIQYHHLLPSSAGSSEEQEGDQTGLFRKIITLQRVHVSLVMHLSSAWREEVETYIAVPCSKELGEVDSFPTRPWRQTGLSGPPLMPRKLPN